MRKKLSLILFFFAALLAASQQVPINQRDDLAIGFWNVENLYDTLDDPLKNDDDFTPRGLLKWDSVKYFQKIEHLSEVIDEISQKSKPHGLAMMGLCEVENAGVLSDLLRSPLLRAYQYRFVIQEGPDVRGIDPALIYDPRLFQPTEVKSFPVRVVTDSTHPTRNVLLVRGLFFGQQLVVLVNHWPSRRGGEFSSRPNRLSAAARVRGICDSLLNADSELHLIVMGDFNDDPVDESVCQLTAGNKFYNPMMKPYKKGLGTLAWRDSWNLFDQVILSPSFRISTGKNWQYKEVFIFNPSFLRIISGNFRAYPYRTYNGSSYAGGYSDHFPVYLVLTREKR